MDKRSEQLTLDALDVVNQEVDLNRVGVVNLAISKLGTGYDPAYSTVANGPWTGSHNPAWCGLFTLWCQHGAGINRDLSWVWGAGYILKLAPQSVRSTSTGDVIYFPHYSHHALAIPDKRADWIYLINGNGEGGEVSISHQTVDQLRLAHASSFNILARKL